MSEFTAENIGIMLKDLILACVFFIMFIYCSIDLYNVVINSSAMTTGNITVDGLLSIFGMFFAACFVLIMYKNFVQSEGG
jgi:tRNA(His) 5'-end guanylyltransferase